MDTNGHEWEYWSSSFARWANTENENKIDIEFRCFSPFFSLFLPFSPFFSLFHTTFFSGWPIRQPRRRVGGAPNAFGGADASCQAGRSNASLGDLASGPTDWFVTEREV